MSTAYTFSIKADNFIELINITSSCLTLTEVGLIPFCFPMFV